MYQPVHFVEERLDVIHAAIRAHPLGLLVSNGADGPLANPLPFLLDAEKGPKGRLLSHMARANPQWRAIEAAPATPVLVVFQGPQAYVTPSWYETKRETGMVVPTWNYVIVQARGRARAIHDRDWLHAQVNAVTDRHEANRAQPWKVADAPDDFVERQLRAIVGIEIEIESLAGKWKASQNRPHADRYGVHHGMGADEAGVEMARLVGERIPPQAS
jgi:transcriptional regulator